MLDISATKPTNAFSLPAASKEKRFALAAVAH